VLELVIVHHILAAAHIAFVVGEDCEAGADSAPPREHISSSGPYYLPEAAYLCQLGRIVGWV
jgi:hypothetical protein